MYVVLGATGHIGASVVDRLKSKGERVLAVVHSHEKAEQLSDGLLEAVAVDVLDTASLRAVLRRGSRAFLLNPPASPGGNTNAEELRTARSIADAVSGTALQKIVVASTYGAVTGDGIGDLSVLHEFEQRVVATGLPTAINRGAYYYTNLDALLPAAREGRTQTPFPPDFLLPMVAPADLAHAATTRLTAPVSDVGVQYVEGPQRYTFSEVAMSFSKALRRDVQVEQIPREDIEKSFLGLGFSSAAARAYTLMTEAVLDAETHPVAYTRGTVTLDEYINNLTN